MSALLPEARQTRIQTVCLTILAAVATGWVLAWARPVLLPFVLAVIVVLSLSPIADLLTKRLRCPRPLAILGTLIFALGVLLLVSVTVSISVASLVANAATYQRQIGILIDTALESLPLGYFGLDPDTVLAQIPLNAVSAVLVGTGNALVDILSQGFLVIIFVVFLFVGGQSSSTRPLGGIWSEVRNRVQRYVTTKVVVSTATGAIVGTILTVLGIPLAAMFGLMAFLLNFIPSVGSIVSTLLPLPIVLVNPDIGLARAVLAIALPGLVQVTFGNFVEPRAIGESLDLHPVVILMSLVFWGLLWGIVGMFLAVPMTAVLKILMERVEHTQPVAEAMGGRLDALLGDED